MYVRCMLECGITAFNAYKQKDVILLKEVQITLLVDYERSKRHAC